MNKAMNYLDIEEDLIWAMKKKQENIKRLNSEVIWPTSRQQGDMNMLKYHKTSVVQLMATMVPNHVISYFYEQSVNVFQGCLLLGKFSGTTDLFNYYCKGRNGSVQQVTKTLDQCMSLVLEEIMGFEGDVLSLTGDSFMVLWKSNEETFNYHVHSALNCALLIEKKFNEFNAEHEYVMRVKLILSAGTVMYSLLSGYDISSYVFMGQPVDDLELAGKHAFYGDIVITPSAWKYMNPDEYSAVPIRNTRFIKILGVGSHWRGTGRQSIKRKENVFESIQTARFSEDVDSQESDDYLYKTENFYSLRPILIDLQCAREYLAKFMLPPVLNFLLGEQSLGGLEEIRLLVFMILNVEMNKAVADNPDIVKECYKIVSSTATEYKGVITTTSASLVHVNFTVVFGMKGLTAVMESREALRCAVRCRHQLGLLDEARIVSVGVATGRCYCGVFGHALRKNYVVHGECATKAEQMARAHVGKVTCDRTSFVYSKIDASNFALLDEDTDQDPVYEFSGEIEVSVLPADTNLLPLLGRDEELKLFHKLFTVYLKNFGIQPCCSVARCTFKNCILIDGVYKQGKTSLLQEFAVLAGDVDVEMFSFYDNDQMRRFNGVRQIMKKAIESGHFVPESLRRKRIIEKMETSATPSLLYALNEVFDVNFSEPPEELSDDEILGCREKSIQILCTKCFIKPALILMDNADFMDDETWNILIPMLETKCFFLVATTDKNTRSSFLSEKITESHHIESIELKSVPHIYLAPLACQILGVFAIPGDLEKVIQLYSKGNPGWIENFLLVLKQTSKIKIDVIDFKMIQEMALVAPPLYMLKRLSPHSVAYYKTLMEERSLYRSEGLDPWEVYIDCCRDAFKDVNVRYKLHQVLYKKSEVPVCLLGQNIDPEMDVDPHVTEDLTFLTMYDELSFQDQLALRCSSLLGDPFTRRILFYLWMPESDLDAAQVIQNLFEKGILCCARGDFTSGGDYILYRDKTTNSPFTNVAECRCVGLDVHDTCLMLPKYASCGFMRFRCERFAETVYNLTPENDRKVLHSKAATFLLEETRRCVSCGCGYFQPGLKFKMDSTPTGRVQDQEKKKKSLHFAQMDFEELYDYSRATFTKSFDQRDNRSRVSNTYGFMKSYTVSSLGDERFIDQSFSDKHARPFVYSNPLSVSRLRKETSLVRTFSKSDFLSCECHLILNYMYKCLKRHYIGSEQWKDVVLMCISYARISMTNKNYASSLNTIEEAVQFLTNKGHLFDGPTWIIKMLIAKFYSLKGKVLFELDQIEEAHEYFLLAMTTFGLHFPEDENSLKFGMKLLRQKWKQKFRLYFIPGSFLHDVTDPRLLYISNTISETLSNLCSIYMMKNQWKLAELAAIISLTQSLQTETSLIRMCQSFTHMLSIAHHYKNNWLWISLEVHALRICHRKRNYVEPPELKAVCQLYTAIFKARTSRAEYDSALHIGYTVISIATKCNQMSYTVEVFTLISHILLDKLIVSDASTILNELEYFVDEVDCKSGRTWYYALSVGFHLETGYIITSFSSAEAYYLKQGRRLCDDHKHYEAKMRLLITIWVWYLRNGKWENALSLKSHIQQYRQFKVDSNNHAISYLYLLEGTLLCLVNKINRRSINGMKEEKIKVEFLIKKLHDISLYAKFINPKLYLLEAYYFYILENLEKTKKLLKKCRKYCAAYDNNMVLLHLEHSEKAWKNELSGAARDLWRNHCKHDTFLSYHEMEFDNLKLHCFTYPKPLFRI